MDKDERELIAILDEHEKELWTKRRRITSRIRHIQDDINLATPLLHDNQANSVQSKHKLNRLQHHMQFYQNALFKLNNSIIIVRKALLRQKKASLHNDLATQMEQLSQGLTSIALDQKQSLT